jgi:hypothetical protein
LDYKIQSLMIENCKIKLIFKSKEPAELFQTITHKNKSSAPAHQSQPSQFLQRAGRRGEGEKHTLGLKATIISQVRLEGSPTKTFRNAKISESIIPACQVPS